MKTKKNEFFQQGLKRAASSGLHVVEPARNEVQVDLDGVRGMKVFCHHLFIMENGRLTKGWRFKVSASKTPGHIHVTVTLPGPLPMEERLLLAALLGDDLKRGAFNYTRAKNRNKYPVAFFEPANLEVRGAFQCLKELAAMPCATKGPKSRPL